jgi:hypothetical protein
MAKQLIDIISGDVEDTLSAKKKAGPSRRRAGGLKGGKARAAKLTPEERRQIAKKAAAGRWRRPSS